jgi:hypothetical protein
MLVYLTNRLNSDPNSLGDSAKGVFCSRHKLSAPWRYWPCLINKLYPSFLLSARSPQEGRFAEEVEGELFFRGFTYPKSS